MIPKSEEKELKSSQKYNNQHLITLKHEMPEHLSKHCPENHISVSEPLFRMNASFIFLFDSI